MGCVKPRQATFTIREDGKKNVSFSNANARLFAAGHKINSPDSLTIPCGQCITCRLERSKQWAVRCMDEASLYDKNCFVTLTYDPSFLPFDRSLDRKVASGFLKSLRRFDAYDREKKGLEFRKIRTLYCGEYGEKPDEFGNKLGRPHYHFILFNFDFDDKVYWKTVNSFRYYVSESLSSIWKKGFCTIGDVSFDSCAYVARYCTKKLNGTIAEEHYKKFVSSDLVVNVLPEFGQASLKPGIGTPWLDKFGFSDVFNLDEKISRGVSMKPPRAYDRYLQKVDPILYQKNKEERDVLRKKLKDDNTFQRLLAKERCCEARIKCLVRRMEND